MALVTFIGRFAGVDMRPGTVDNTSYVAPQYSGGTVRYTVVEGGLPKGVADFAGFGPFFGSGLITTALFQTVQGVAAWQVLFVDAKTFFSLNALPTQGPLLAYMLRGPDVITGSMLNDQLWGYGGTDAIKGARGNDVIVGGSGNDNLDGGSGSDILSYEDRGTNLVMTLGAQGNGAARIGSEVDTYKAFEGLAGGKGHDSLTGNALANTLSGGSGNDRLMGAAGNDSLRGGVGSDTLFGGSGVDRFVFRDGDQGADIIRDFAKSGREEDVLVFDPGLFASRAAVIAAMKDVAGGLLIRHEDGTVLLAGLTRADAMDLKFEFFAA